MSNRTGGISLLPFLFCLYCWCPHRCMADDSFQTFDVIVIGAGVSGLAAARQLQQQGKKVVVVEARSRVGGRVWTEQVVLPNGTIQIDLGASWIHGVSGNPITQIAKDNRIKTVPFNYDDRSLFYTEGSKLSAADIDALDSLEESFLNFVGKLKGVSSNISIQQAAERYRTEKGLSSAAWRQLSYLINADIEQEYGADASQLSLKQYDEDEAFPGEDVLFPGGYGQVVQVLAQGLDIRLNHTVTEVRYETNKAVVTTNHGLFNSSAVVVTLPLGVLKAQTVSFVPPLPARKTEAINKLGMGLLDKVIFLFDTLTFETKQWIGRISPTEKNGEWTECANLQAALNIPGLMCFNAASFARQVENLSDAEAFTAGIAAFRQVYGDKFPEPIKMLRTSWAMDPFSRAMFWEKALSGGLKCCTHVLTTASNGHTGSHAWGSYSFQTVGATFDDNRALGSTVDGTLYFAGEATSTDNPSTVHGAYMSGTRAASLIIKDQKSAAHRARLVPGLSIALACIAVALMAL